MPKATALSFRVSALYGEYGVGSLRGTIGGEKERVKLTHWGPVCDRRLRTERGYFVAGRTGRGPAENRLASGFLADPIAQVHNGTTNFLAGFLAFEAKVVSWRDHLLHNDQGAMRIDDLGEGFFGKTSAVEFLPETMTWTTRRRPWLRPTEPVRGNLF